jgi:hypothetical protein
VHLFGTLNENIVCVFHQCLKFDHCLFLSMSLPFHLLFILLSLWAVKSTTINTDAYFVPFLVSVCWLCHKHASLKCINLATTQSIINCHTYTIIYCMDVQCTAAWTNACTFHQAYHHFTPQIFRPASSELLTTNHEVPGSIPGSTMRIFLVGGGSPLWPWSG